MAHALQSDIENCEGWLSPGGHSSGGRALHDSLSQRPPVQSQVAAGFSQFSKNIPEPFHHVHLYQLIVQCDSGTHLLVRRGNLHSSSGFILLLIIRQGFPTICCVGVWCVG